MAEQIESQTDKRIAELTSANTILRANISTLYRTARAEISRKDKRIAQLESELDDLIFKRSRNKQQSPRQMVATGSTEPIGVERK